MSFNGNFLISQSTDISAFTITDTSTGTDSGLTNRTILIQEVDGTILAQVSNWPIANGPYVFPPNTLDKDYSLNVVVQWQSSAPLAPPSTYVKTEIATFVGYSKTFNYSIVQQISARPAVNNDTNYLNSLFTVNLLISNAKLATDFSDQYRAEGSLTELQGIIQNQQLYF